MTTHEQIAAPSNADRRRAELQETLAAAERQLARTKRAAGGRRTEQVIRDEQIVRGLKDSIRRPRKTVIRIMTDAEMSMRMRNAVKEPREPIAMKSCLDCEAEMPVYTTICGKCHTSQWKRS